MPNSFSMKATGYTKKKDTKRRKARKHRFRAFPSPVIGMMPIVVPIAVRPAVIGVGSRTVVIGRTRPVVVTRAVIVGTRCRDRTCRQCAGRKTERQSRPEAARLRRRGHRGG